jgi:16S rRNA (guanine966-N2)-methyltransferase
MRIIAGNLGGRIFSSPGTHKTHPMSDKARGALFNALGDISGLSILDAFAGSGALSFEAISRGALSSTAIDSDRLAQKVIAQNITALGMRSNVKLIKAAAGAWLSTNPNSHFDIILCDPPYDNLQSNLLLRLADRAKPGDLVVLSLPPKSDFTLPGDTFETLIRKNYGDARLLFFARR